MHAKDSPQAIVVAAARKWADLEAQAIEFRAESYWTNTTDCIVSFEVAPDVADLWLNRKIGNALTARNGGEYSPTVRVLVVPDHGVILGKGSNT